MKKEQLVLICTVEQTEGISKPTALFEIWRATRAQELLATPEALLIN